MKNNFKIDSRGWKMLIKLGYITESQETELNKIIKKYKISKNKINSIIVETPSTIYDIYVYIFSIKKNIKNMNSKKYKIALKLYKEMKIKGYNVWNVARKLKFEILR